MTIGADRLLSASPWPVTDDPNMAHPAPHIASRQAPIINQLTYGGMVRRRADGGGAAPVSSASIRWYRSARLTSG